MLTVYKKYTNLLKLVFTELEKYASSENVWGRGAFPQESEEFFGTLI